MEEKILVLDFGGQYNQLIARRVRDHHVYEEVKPYKTPLDVLRAQNYKGIIFTGGPNSVYADGSPRYDAGILELGIPILGICYGIHLLTYLAGGQVSPAVTSEYGRVQVTHTGSSKLFSGIPEASACWMSHTDYIAHIPDGFTVTAQTKDCPCAAFEHADKRLYGVQFHPEVTHTEYGSQILHNFIYEICGCEGAWRMDSFVRDSIEKYRREIGGKRVLLGLSGGVDSSVCAALLHKAIGKNLVCVFVDHGFMRKDEGDLVERIFREKFDLNLIRVNAQDRFLDKLKGVEDPERKRKIIGKEFADVFAEEASKLGTIEYLAQGTIYPDIVESGVGDAAVIKSHHNVGGLPEDIGFEGVVEPLRDLFKDEVRRAGVELGLPDELVYRQPFPGPGLAIRIIGEVTRDKLDILREADAIFREELERSGLSENINQYFAILPGNRSVGVMGDARTYDYTIALRAVSTTDFMTADWAKIPLDALERISNRLTNEVEHVNRVVYDITSKPPATIEWE
ncbi:MAG: glutamine-hydrolyzing GMP synthase [Clostridiales bacterium]|nr:glutamine-hydrolyzing GMP synthase [Clostridiales bacterium]